LTAGGEDAGGHVGEVGVAGIGLRRDGADGPAQLADAALVGEQHPEYAFEFQGRRRWLGAEPAGEGFPPGGGDGVDGAPAPPDQVPGRFGVPGLVEREYGGPGWHWWKDPTAYLVLAVPLVPALFGLWLVRRARHGKN
jgi:hypothetical protein